MGDRLKIFNVNSYSSFSFPILIFYFLTFLSLPFSHSNSIIYGLCSTWLNLFSNLLIYFWSLRINTLICMSFPLPSALFSTSLSINLIIGWLLSTSLRIYHLLFSSKRLSINTLSSSSWLRLVFWKSIHLEVASGPFCLLINSSWLLVFALCIFFLSLSGFNLYCWRGIHFSWSNSLIFLVIFSNLLFSFHFWFRDLLRELAKKYEILLMVLFLLFFLFLASEALLFISFFWASFHSLSSLTLGICPVEGFYLPDSCELTFSNTLLLSNAAVSLGGAFVSLEISSQFLIFFSLFSFLLAWTFISLQIKEFRIMGLSINDSVYSSLFFFLTGLHFFHLLVGLLLLCLFFLGL